MSADPRSSRRRGGRLWAILMTVVAIAALREAAFAKNRTTATTPHPPDRPTPPADPAPPGATA